MKVEITDVSSTKKEMKVTILQEEVNSVTNEIYSEITKGASVRGFRKGKAPRDVIRMYYADYIRDELTRKLVREKFEQAVKDNELFVVSMPEIQNEVPRENEEFSFSAQFEVKPVITLQKISGFELKKPKIEVKEDNVQDVLHKLQETYATVKDVEDDGYLVSKGDYVVVTVSSEEEPEINREKMTVEAGTRSAFPGLELEVLGMKQGEEKHVDIAFPDDHFLEAVKGKTVHATLLVTAIKLRELPELDDEFAKKIRVDTETLEDLKRAIGDDLTSRLEADSRSYIERQIREKLVAENSFEIPESMVRLQAMMMIQGISQQLNAQGMKMQDLYPDPEALKEETMASAENIVRSSLIVEAIAKEQDIAVSDEDVEKEISALAERYGMSPGAVKANMEERGGLDEMKFGILEKKVYDYVTENSSVEEVEKVEEVSDDAGSDSGGTDK
ncbi:MAG TPA: trigger factor [Deltaproteobacteria bacterium]|nr:trigger factor [Deltaproteobacteria bacterium]